MKLFKPLSLAIAARYIFSGKSHRFASFVALLSTIGIAIGVAALIADTAIMQGLQSRLKGAILNSVPHVVVYSDSKSIPKLLKLPHVIAAAPFVQGQALLQTKSAVSLVRLIGINPNQITLNPNTAASKLKLEKVPMQGSFELNAESSLFLENDLHLGSKVRLISTDNASYTPMGLTPSQRIFTLSYYHQSASSSSGLYHATGNYDDVRRLLRIKAEPYQIRLWLDDPFNIDEVRQKLLSYGFKYEDWTVEQGEFFKAVALEKLTMTLMLCLIVLVASFNILSALTMMVSSRMTEIAILKTLGMSRIEILTIFLLMGLGCSVSGSLVGVILGVPLSFYASKIMNMQQALPVDISFENIAIIVAGSLIASLLCTLYPALKASSADPASNLANGV